MELNMKMEVQDGKVKVVNVPGDGNCLFYAIVQQLSGRKVFDAKFYGDAMHLRKATVEYLRGHMVEMKDVILNEIIAMRNESLENLTDEQLKDKMEQHLQNLEKDGTWAGGEVLVALKEILGMNIRIYNPHYHPLDILYGDGLGRTIEIYYNGTNHYDSVEQGVVQENEDEEIDCQINEGFVNIDQVSKKKDEQDQQHDTIRKLTITKDGMARNEEHSINFVIITNKVKWINVGKYRVKVREMKVTYGQLAIN